MLVLTIRALSYINLGSSSSIIYADVFSGEIHSTFAGAVLGEKRYEVFSAMSALLPKFIFEAFVKMFQFWLICH